MGRRQRGEGALYQRHNHPSCPPLAQTTLPDGSVQRVRPDHDCHGLWVARVEIGADPGTGRRIYRQVTARRQRDAVRKLAELRQAVQVAGGLLPSGRQWTVRQWLEYWVEHVAADKPGTRRFYRTQVRSHLIPALGRLRLDRLGPQHVRQMHATVRAKTRTVNGQQVPLSATAVHHAHRTLATALEAAVRESEGRLLRNPCDMVPTPGRAKPDRPALTTAQARAVLTAAADDRMSSRWMAALLLGARQGECLGLRWQHVDLDAWTVDLAWQLQRLYYRHGCGPARPDGSRPCGRTRGGSCPDRELDAPADYERIVLDGGLCLVRPKSAAGQRLLPLVAPLHAALVARRRAYEAERAGYLRGHDHDLVWARPDGRPVRARDDDQAWAAALASAGVGRADLHAARHTAATLLMELGVPSRIIEQVVGHSSAVSTQAYLHVDLTMARDALGRLAGQILGSGRPLELPAGAGEDGDPWLRR